ncbi:MAG: hypothetical protein GX216_02375 [Methanomicrobiales archaeon]|nr:hypothetical protein [Methanomicrobiales archaeon]
MTWIPAKIPPDHHRPDGHRVAGVVHRIDEAPGADLRDERPGHDRDGDRGERGGGG